MQYIKYLFLGVLVSNLAFAERWYMPNKGVSDAQISGFSFPKNDVNKYQSVISDALGKSKPITLDNNQNIEGKSFQEDTILYFATFNMSKKSLKDMMVSSIKTGGTVVFRGVKNKGDSIEQITIDIQNIVTSFGLNEIPNVVVNPSFFENYMVKVAPTIVFQRKDDISAYKVSGLVDSDWLFDKIDELESRDGSLKEGELYDLEVRGNIVEITEENLINDMKNRVLKHDWEQEKLNAINHYFENVALFDMPKSIASSERVLDMSLTVKEDILDGSGNVIAKKGFKVDPAKYMSLSKYIVIFNPLDEKEMNFAKKMRLKAESDNKGIKYIVTQINREGGTRYMGGLNVELESNFSIMTEYFKNRFGVRTTPSIIYTKDEQIMIQEVSLD